MNKKLNVTVRFIDNVDCKYSDTKFNLCLRESGGEDLTVEEVIYFVFEFFERIDILLFHTLAILF